MTLQAPVNTKFFVSLSVTLPYTKSAFDTAKQEKYKKAVASAAGTVTANVDIVSISEARRRAGSVKVETKVRLHTCYKTPSHDATVSGNVA